MPGKASKINPENSDFIVGKFLTKDKRAASRLEAALSFICLSGQQFFSRCLVIFQVYINPFFLDIYILFNEIVYVDIMFDNTF